MEQTLTLPRNRHATEPAANPITAPFVARLQETVSELARRPALFWCLLLAVNAVALPYNGFNHDSRLYAAQVMERVEPGSFGEDLYLRFGSQDRFTIWTPLTAPFVAVLGLPLAYLLLYYVSKGLFFLAALCFVRRLLKDDTATVLSLIVIAMLPLPIGGHRTFHLNESFLTPRILAPAMVMFSLERMLAGRPLIAILLQLFAVALHPLMALAGLVTYFFWGMLRILPGLRFIAFLALATMAAAAAVLYAPLGHRLFGFMDEEWRTVNLRVCFFVRPETWNWADWWSVGIAFVAALLGVYYSLSSERRILWGMILAGVAGLIGSFIGVFSDYLLLIQVSPYRTLWLVQFLATPLFFLAIVKLWRADTPVARTLSLGLLLLIAPIDWEFETQVPFQLGLLVLFAVVVCFYRGLAASMSEGGEPANNWLLPSALTTFLLGFVYLCLYDLGLLVLFAGIPPDFQTDMHPIHKLQVSSMALYKLPVLVFMLLVTRWLLARFTPRTVMAVLVGFTLLYHPFIAFVPKMEWFGMRFSTRYDHHRFVADFVKEHTPPDRKLTIYWPNDIRFHWYQCEALCYFNWVQLSGSAFDRGNAIEGKRRALMVRPFEIAELLLTPQKEGWSRPFANFFDIPLPPDRKPHEVLEDQPPPNRADLLRVCQEPGLDYIVLETPVEDLHCATSGKIYIYDCRALRERFQLSCVPQS